MIKYLNNVVVKLWLTIILIVTTVLILLSAALIAFLQQYFTSETEDAILQNAKRISQLVSTADDQSVAIMHSQTLIENPGGLIILNKQTGKDETTSSSEVKQKMLDEIKSDKTYDRVFEKGQPEIKHVTKTINGTEHTYVLLGYPTKLTGQDGAHSGVFIYQDLKSAEDTNNVITIIILITAVIFLGITTVFAFFLSSRITKPLRQLRTQALNVTQGNYGNSVPENKAGDEIGELSRTFNAMSVEIKEHVDALESSKNVRDSIINSMVEGVLGINDDRHIILSNTLAKRMLANLDADTKARFDEQIELTFKNKTDQFYEYDTKKRHYVVIMSYIDQIQHDGQSGIVVVIRDMTNEHNLDQMKKDFIANVSHELRTPISLLQGYTESIVDGIVTEPEEIRESLSIVLDETKRLNRLVNELLNVARMDAEGLTVDKAEQPIGVLLNKMQHKYRQLAAELQLNMHLNPDTQGAQWCYDADRIEQVLTNLVDNASRYTEPGDTISISVQETSRYHVLRIEDTGTGIAPEHLEHVFDRFYKVDAARKRGKQGTGLGLFICRMIIEAHGGRIDVTSTLNEGTTFIIKLPRG